MAADERPDGDGERPDGDGGAGQDGGRRELDFGELKDREREKRQTTKEYIVEYDDGAYATFEYRMVDGLSQIIDDHTVRRPTRTGQETVEEVDNEYALARDVLKEGIVDAPDGFEITERALRDHITDELMDGLFEAIVNFSTMDEVTRRKFRGVGVRE